MIQNEGRNNSKESNMEQEQRNVMVVFFNHVEKVVLMRYPPCPQRNGLLIPECVVHRGAPGLWP